MTAGRKRNNEPALAWDYRRIKALVDVLALDESDASIAALQLCRDWGVAPRRDLDGYGTIRALARHALEYSRRQPEIPPDCAVDLIDEYPENM